MAGPISNRARLAAEQAAMRAAVRASAPAPAEPPDLSGLLARLGALEADLGALRAHVAELEELVLADAPAVDDADALTDSMTGPPAPEET